MENSFIIKYKKYILPSIIVLVLIIVTIILGVSFSNKPATDASFREDTDPTSGSAIYISDAEPEDKNTLGMVGFDILYNLGFSAAQQEAIYNTIQEYILNNHPDTSVVSYIKDSFLYTSTDSNDFSKSTFRIKLDTNETFTIELDTQDQINTIKIDIN